ncbi:MAG: hypothetical protein GVY17_07540 [Cyanobacteria bacterium]|jgi:hypothetical protein|nr:hypothetical protein [Cyanobacteria bacterium GSL.Bin21]
MKTYAVTGARGTTPEQNETIRNAVKAHVGGSWHIGDATGADATATTQAQQQGDTVTTYYADKGLARAGYAVRSMRMIDGAIAQGAKKLLAFPNKPCPAECTPKKPFNGHGSGTWGTIAYAKKKGLEVEIYPLSPTAKTPDWLGQLSLF